MVGGKKGIGRVASNTRNCPFFKKRIVAYCIGR